MWCHQSNSINHTRDNDMVIKCKITENYLKEKSLSSWTLDLELMIFQYKLNPNYVVMEFVNSKLNNIIKSR